VVRDVANQYYGDRSGQVQDPNGNFWFIATHVEDVSPEEMRRRMTALASVHDDTDGGASNGAAKSGDAKEPEPARS
jgi:hypothetical protein